jgi:hypothetical protein
VPREETEGEAREGVADDEEAIESAGVGWNAVCVLGGVSVYEGVEGEGHRQSERGRALLRMSPRARTAMRTLSSWSLREEICMVEGLASMEVGDRNSRAVQIPSDLSTCVPGQTCECRANTDK